METTSPYYRTAMMTPMASRAALALRMEDSSFRQVERITNLLTKLKARPAQGMDQTFATEPRGRLGTLIDTKKLPTTPSAKNGGISNQVIENKGEREAIGRDIQPSY